MAPLVRKAHMLARMVATPRMVALPRPSICMVQARGMQMALMVKLTGIPLVKLVKMVDTATQRMTMMGQLALPRMGPRTVAMAALIPRSSEAMAEPQMVKQPATATIPHMVLD